MSRLTGDRWRALSPYLDEALEMADDVRQGWLATLAARDAGLAADLELLLAEQAAVHRSGFLEHAVLSPRAVLTQSLEGEILGAYRLISLIGRGGMGSVFLAERCDGRFEGRAAVKVLDVALLGRDGEERFRREGHILARVTHPHIARLIDAGVSPAGQPYLVLEHIDGQSIERYCAERALTVDDRLRLFLDVLAAVAHAHANLIVHRDIKPANVLVSGDGQVKLLDFGIAKLLEADAGWDRSPLLSSGGITREGGTALTPQYAAPEQVSGGLVTTATDVYALGVLLYVLLTGQHPAGPDVRSPATLMRAIVETEPPRPSDVVAAAREGGSDSLAGHAMQCATTPSRLRRALRGDLDTILAKALKKTAADRYASVTALADDVRRYLRREPISARPDTVAYRAARFVRRHAGAVLASAAAVILLAGLIGYHTQRLAAERDRARREAAKAAKVSELMVGLLTSADPYAPRAGLGEPTVRGLLDAGTAQVQKELAGEPELQAEILTDIGRTYRRLGVYDKAQRLLEQALASGRAAFGPEHVRVAQTLHDLGVVLTDKGDYAAAGRSLEQALAMRRRLLGPEHADVAVTLVELGRVYQDQGFNDRADPLQREALAIRTKVLGEDHRETAVSLSAVASVLRLEGDLIGAEGLLRRCLDLNRRTRGDQHPNTGTTLHDLGLVVATRGDYPAAESLFRQALDINRKALGEKHPNNAATLNGLSRALIAQGRYDEAASALQEALDIARPALGRDHQLVAIYTINLASVQLARKQPAVAETLLREGLRIRARAPDLVPGRRRTFLEDDWSVGAAKSLLGASLVALARYDEAERMLLDARGDLQALPQPPARDVNATIARLVDLYQAWHRPEKAAAYRALLAS
jgi:serine/threonine protein kinase/tetratricopeptide (TPR) repeat protein